MWTKEGNVFKAHKVEVGTSNGLLTEIISGVAAGTEVLTDFEIIGGKEEEADENTTSNPFMPRPRGNRNRTGANGAAGGNAGGAPGAAGGGANGGMGGGNRPSGNFPR